MTSIAHNKSRMQDAPQVAGVPETGNDLGIERVTIAEAEKLAAVEFTLMACRAGQMDRSSRSSRG